MIQALFKQVNDGKLRRMEFFGYWMLLVVLMMGFIFAVVAAIGIGEQLLGGDLSQAQDVLRTRFGLPFMLIFAVFMGVICFGSLNIAAKRFRHIGLPGWGAVLVVLILNVVAGRLIDEQAASLVGTIAGLVLLFAPGGLVGQKTT